MKNNLILPLAVALVSIAAGFLLFRYTLYQPQFVSASPARTTQTEPSIDIDYGDIVLNNLQGQPQALTQWQAPVMVINFWAPWCAPCRREIPALVDLQNSYPESVQLLGLSFDSAENVIDFKNDNPINYPLLIVRHESTLINQFFGNNSSGLPFTAILNRDREIVFRHAGEITKTQLERQIKALL